MKTVIYPGPNVAPDAGPVFQSARLGVSLQAGIPTAIEDSAADALLAAGTVRLPAMPKSMARAPEPEKAPAPEPAKDPAPAPAGEGETAAAEAEADAKKGPGKAGRSR